MKFTAIKFKAGDVVLRWREENDVHTLESADPPNKNFIEAMVDLTQEFCAIVDLDFSKEEAIKVTGITITRNDQGTSVLMTARRALKTHGQMGLNSPSVNEANFPPGLDDKIKKLYKLAKKYIDGDRAQLTIDEDAA